MQAERQLSLLSSTSPIISASSPCLHSHDSASNNSRFTSNNVTYRDNNIDIHYGHNHNHTLDDGTLSPHSIRGELGDMDIDITSSQRNKDLLTTMHELLCCPVLYSPTMICINGVSMLQQQIHNGEQNSKLTQSLHPEDGYMDELRTETNDEIISRKRKTSRKVEIEQRNANTSNSNNNNYKISDGSEDVKQGVKQSKSLSVHSENVHDAIDVNTHTQTRPCDPQKEDEKDEVKNTSLTAHAALTAHILHAQCQVAQQIEYLKSLPSDTYLCTNLDIYLSCEPDVTSAMALVHSRIRKVYFIRDNEHQGALKTHFHIHMLKSLNHRYRVYQYVCSDIVK